MLVNDLGSIDESALVFAPEFIRTHNIKSVKGRISIKKPNATIRTTNLYQAYFFDEQGRILSSFEMKSQTDTLWRKYFYNDKGHLIYQSWDQKGEMFFTTYLRDDSLRITAKEDFVRRTDYMGIPFTKALKKESYEYTSTDSSVVKWIKNEMGTLFIKEELFYNSLNHVVREDLRYMATNEGFITMFDYDTHGHMLSCISTTSKQKVEREKFLLKYDALGNPLEKKQFDKGMLVLETQYIVNETTGYLTAVIEQKGESNELKIIRFQSYDFYD